ncbi:MAG: peptide chain release factor N(5)-glutamine methyltransferase [Pseudomonadales bacterium]|nr:peptide chain release factor N(5)-glutamine methyltransferase [Pseudomonadales bacterium]
MQTLNVKHALAMQHQLDNSHTPQLDCQLILGHILNKTRSWLIAFDDYQLSAAEYADFISALNARRAGKPVAYIIGIQEFWSLEFSVTAATLIPRPDTELLVETILQQPSNDAATVIDLGTGSGAIAIAIASERPNYTVVATDRSAECLQVAKKNSQQLARNSVGFIQANWLNGFKASQFDIIVSNPPYIEIEDPHLGALCYEPTAALISPDDGLNDIKQIISAAPDYLKPNGMIIIEHGYNQQSQVTALMASSNFSRIKPLTDLNNQPRAVLAFM